MSLSGIYISMWRDASERGTDQARALHGGARLAVRVADGVTTLTISRKQKPVGDVELKTFVRDCGVPDTAARYPLEGQGQRRDADGVAWHFVAFRWADES